MLALWLVAGPGQGLVLDRIAVTVDDRVITLSDVLEEIRLAALLDGVPVQITPESKRQAARRLVEHVLLSRDMELTRYPLPSDEEVNQFIEQIRRARGLDAKTWEAEAHRYEIEPDRLREHLRRRLGILRYIAFRFRPEVQPGPADSSQAAPAADSRVAGVSERAIAAAREAAQSALAARQVDELVDAWLREAKQRARIRWREEAFQ
ncbi:MAG: hypothetical protein ACP5U2_03895 [Bryobacteraceae bacterium]